MSLNGDDRSGSDRLAKGEPSVLASLPSTRPQRPSTRRAAARQETKARATRTAGNGAKPTAGRARAGQAAKAGAAKAAKAGAAKAAKAGAAKTAKAGAGQSAKSRAKRTTEPSREPTTRHLRSDEQPAPPQGFDAEGGIETGAPVQPPSGVELAASVAELIGELAQSGLSSGGRLLKSALARLPGL
jgi:hypothetical protein